MPAPDHGNHERITCVLSTVVPTASSLSPLWPFALVHLALIAWTAEVIWPGAG